MARVDPLILAHLEWIGFVRPTGLVVSAPALVRAGAILDRRDADGQRLLRAAAEERIVDPKIGPVSYLPDFRSFASSVLDWSFSPRSFAGTDESPIPSELEAPLADYGETLRPDFAVREPEPKDGASPWQLLVSVLEPGLGFDQVVRGPGHSQLDASATSRMERMLRQTSAAAGLLFNGSALRLISAPRGESSGWLDFVVADMVQTAGRPISTAMRLLLRQSRLLSLPRAQRLAALLEDSRRFQNEVSERLAQQVLHALYELLRGFQAAHDASRRELLRQPLAERPDEVYRALLTVILRLVFLLYAEERGMLPDNANFQRYYSLAGLYERLREDAALYPDTMDQRYGAWAQLLAVFRMVEEGAHAGAMRLPARRGVLFDRDRFPFLEGRASDDLLQARGRVEAPLVPDGTIFRALDKLLVLDGERISYRALDVEQIGSVYETMMGFQLETATGRSVAIKPIKKHGAPTTVDLERLLGEPAAKRERWLQDRTDRKVGEAVRKPMLGAESIEDLHAALEPVIDLAATPDLVPSGAMVLQPSEERRRSGSHYTPRALTQPIVRTTLEPILARLRGVDGRPPLPAQILDLKVCDPAMGSGAFLVEACRQLGDALIDSWHVHGEVPTIPPDEDEVIFARRLVAQRCLYGVDRNPMAVDLAKVSLWLATLAQDHALTFVDHVLRHGDSLVGLSRNQVEAFHWDPNAPRFNAGFETMRVRDHVVRVSDLRRRIRDAGESASDAELRELWDEAQFELDKVRLFGDLVLAAFFEGDTPRDREARRAEYALAVLETEATQYHRQLREWRQAQRPLVPFHWEFEYPEVFERTNPGFDLFVGNPPFLGGTMISTANSPAYRDYISDATPDAGGRCDLVAYFFRRAYRLSRSGGAMGLIGTKTVAQSDTRRGGLSAIIADGGRIFCAETAMKWPGEASVTVSIVHVGKQFPNGPAQLNGRPCIHINPFLLPSTADGEPHQLETEVDYFLGSKIYGQGFLFDDGDPEATPVAVMWEILTKEPDSRLVIRPYVGGNEVNSSGRGVRWAIDFGELDEVHARRYPSLWRLVSDKLPSSRARAPRQVQAIPFWWYFNRRTPQYRRARKLERVLVRSAVSEHHVFRWMSPDQVFSHNVFVLIDSSDATFTLLHSRVHEVWVNLTSSSLEDRQGYRPSDCLTSFPFPREWRVSSDLGASGATYAEFRDEVMIRTGEGLTDTYNRFHDPGARDPQILKLRELHAAMDRAVLDAYGWSDIPTDCEFLLDHEFDEEELGNRKKPYRYRWPDDVRDQVLARLLELNAERAREEARSGATATRKATRRAVAKGTPDGGPTLGLLG